ncbi:chitin synthase [Malassezia vespertilionis]|nr:chitin synthase [Malassezia vespertilionis]WFD06900.1 chitin synthase [Malassezia vespertilionis]
MSGEKSLDPTSGLSDSEDELVTRLCHRYYQSQYYTQLQEAVLVVLNPYHTAVDVNGDDVLRAYLNAYRDVRYTTNANQQPPHIFGVACHAYYYMQRTGQDQSMFFMGETGSGKSEARRLALRAILELSVALPGKRGARLGFQLPAALYAMECFGNAESDENVNASAMGLYSELQFSEKGRLLGMKMLNYYLERSRVSPMRSNERTFTVFYMLIAGASPQDRRRWRFDDVPSFRLLTAGGRSVPGIDALRLDARFQRLLGALDTVGLPQRRAMFDTLAAILHISNLEFVHDDGPHTAARITFEEPLYIAASLLGVGASALANALTHLTKVVRGKLCTVMLDANGALANRDMLMRMLYSLVFAWLNEQLNVALSSDQFTTYLGLFDVPSWSNRIHNTLDQFAVNYAADTVHRHMMYALLDRRVDEMDHEGLSHMAPLPAAADETERVRLLTHYPGGLLHIMDDQTRRRSRKTDQTMVDAMQKRWVNHAALRIDPPDRLGPQPFTVTHFHGDVTYDANEWLAWNDESFALEHVSLLRGSGHTKDGTSGFGSSSPFIRSLFKTAAVWTQLPTEQEGVLGGQASLRPLRAPSAKRAARSNTIRASASRRQAEHDEEVYGNTIHDAEHEPKHGEMPCVLGETRNALDTLLHVLDETKPWFVLCIRPNGNQLPNQCEPRMIRRQVHAMGLVHLRCRHVRDYSVTLTYVEFCDRYGVIAGLDSLGLLGVPRNEAKVRVSDACALMNWSDTHVAMGIHKVFLTYDVFRELEDYLRACDPEEMQYNLRKAAADAVTVPDPFSPYVDAAVAPAEHPNPFAPVQEDRAASLYMGEYGAQETQSLLLPDEDMEHDTTTIMRDDLDAGPGETGMAEGPRVAEKVSVSRLRRNWVAFTWLLTFWIPSFVLKAKKSLRRSDVRMAWREKLVINMLIWFVCICSIFVIVFLGNVVCPKEHLISTDELAGHKGKDGYTAIRGEVFDLTPIIDAHVAAVPVVSRRSLQQYAGQDATHIFPVQVNALCNGVTGNISPWVTMDNSNTSDPHAQYHDFRAHTMYDVRPDWYYEQMWYMRSQYRVAMIGYTNKDLTKITTDGRSVAYYNKEIYDISDYVANGNQGGVRVPQGMATPPNLNRQILAPEIVDLITQNPGADITKRLDALNLDPALLARQRVCLRNLFFIGKVDYRNSARCQFASYILLAISLIMVTTIGFKFFAALQFGIARPAEEQEKFVICQVPCYTEGADSIRKTVDSLAKLRYDDRRKLLLIICDGNVVGAGNEAPTPELVLDLLGADTSAEPAPRSFVSLGEGGKQHNMARVYSGLYEHAGHMVPYIVVAKCGKPSEHAKPGNRGKRDSQLITMRFLNKVHFGLPMSPLELEMYHHIKNIIGVNPSFYEYLLQVDADTEVDPAALTRLVSAFVHDKKVVGLCGETALSNEQQSITTMLQVYEYYISHYMVKAFESLFGSITCLPGCFSMFRLRAPDTQRPLFISNAVLDDYAENRVDTLHLKNLLYLGEDRYLTTLMLKHFPDHKTTFVRHAKCTTTAPESWRILLSQRRRWINSTVHNLVELLRTPQLCGFCLFSMRFVVMIDLLSTIIAPVTIVYLVFLILVCAIDGGTIPLTSVILLAAIYGFQMIIFLLHRRFDMIGWMIVYIIGLPLWAFILPLYAFWHMDDFSWGNTRVVTSQHGETLVLHNEGTYDPAEIPHMTWEAYENELWEKRDAHDTARHVPGAQSTRSEMVRAPSLYGYASCPIPAYSDDFHRFSKGSEDEKVWNAWDASSMGHYGEMVHVGTRPTSYAYRDVQQEPLLPMEPTGYTWEPLVKEKRRSDTSLPLRADSPQEGALVDVKPHKLPHDEVIRHDIRSILAQSDLTTTTKRQLRAQLQELYGCPIDAKKAYINAQIEAALRQV